MHACMYVKHIAIFLFSIIDTDQATIIQQTIQETRSIGVQCDLLAAPPLKKLTRQSDFESSTSDTCTEDTDLGTDLDTSFQIIHEDTTTE